MLLLRYMSVLALASLLQAHPKAETPRGELRYRVEIAFRRDVTPIRAHFMLVPTPIVATHNKVKKPRLGGWRLEGIQTSTDTFNMAALLGRIERLLYFSSPSPGVVPRDIVVKIGQRRCPIWQIEAPKNLSVYAYLAEVSPGLLAVSYLSGSFSKGDIATLELQLEDFQIGQEAGPAENGTALLGTLRRLADLPDSETEETADVKVVDAK